ncbi:uncharacterized protein LOC118193672 [Stegodyphus dumicola]|uniref:uncharacterized protein LOC118193672 n=1 Tax=Stegodyphus dumicola TaxID=202533 RepID=UPI0015AF7321|nr:uncharacterized protein LOC118193672 [Stegodyphus dumicola]
MLTLNLGLRREFQFLFILSKINKGTLGADFLNKFKLIIDLHGKKLTDGVTQLKVTGEVASISENSDIVTVNHSTKFNTLLKQYPDLCKTNLFLSGLRHNVEHHIITHDEPVHSQARQLNPRKLAVVKQEFQFMLDNNIIRPSNSQWASPFHVVLKKMVLFAHVEIIDS